MARDSPPTPPSLHSLGRISAVRSVSSSTTLHRTLATGFSCASSKVAMVAPSESFLPRNARRSSSPAWSASLVHAPPIRSSTSTRTGQPKSGLVGATELTSQPAPGRSSERRFAVPAGRSTGRERRPRTFGMATWTAPSAPANESLGRSSTLSPDPTFRASRQVRPNCAALRSDRKRYVVHDRANEGAVMVRAGSLCLTHRTSLYPSAPRSGRDASSLASRSSERS